MWEGDVASSGREPLQAPAPRQTARPAERLPEGKPELGKRWRSRCLVLKKRGDRMGRGWGQRGTTSGRALGDRNGPPGPWGTARQRDGPGLTSQQFRCVSETWVSHQGVAVCHSVSSFRVRAAGDADGDKPSSVRLRLLMHVRVVQTPASGCAGRQRGRLTPDSQGSAIRGGISRGVRLSWFLAASMPGTGISTVLESSK